ncbi:MAG: hypothetical protein PF588_02425 [Candidatus Kapabacteria bacterium]|jgi:hypothetical protein|nr:hypothetical protein [Candidatus Kapabacteria bacterium]
MKRFTILGLVLISLIIAACGDSSVNPADGNNPNGSYYPLAVGNYWIYETEEGSGADVQRDTIRNEVFSTVEIDGETWFKTSFDEPPVRWENDTLNFYDNNGKSPGFLNENMKAGDTLYYEADGDDDSSTEYLVIVEESGIVENVSGRNYSNVVLVTSTYSEVVNGTTRREIFKLMSYWSKGIGLIKSVSELRSFSLIDYHIEN